LRLSLGHEKTRTKFALLKRKVLSFYSSQKKLRLLDKRNNTRVEVEASSPNFIDKGAETHDWDPKPASGPLDHISQKHSLHRRGHAEYMGASAGHPLPAHV
jgi:hypothetical protein